MTWSVGFYRLHYLEGFSGGIVRVREFDADSDDAATAYGEEVRALTAMELWEGARKVRTWDAFPPMASDD